MNQLLNQQPSVLRYEIPNISLENIEILQIKCTDFDNGIFINNKIVQVALVQKDHELETLKQKLKEIQDKQENKVQGETNAQL